MLRHEHFEELCAAASIGQIGGAELAELQEHLPWCDTCRDRYSAFLGLNAAQYANSIRDTEMNPELAVSAIDSNLLRARFFRKAEAEGIVFSGAGADRPIPEPSMRRETLLWSRHQVGRVAAVAVIASLIVAGGYYVGARHTGMDQPPRSVNNLNRAALSKLEAENRNLANEIQLLKSSLQSESSKLSEVHARAAASKRDRQLLVARAKEQEGRIADLQTRLDQAQTAVTNIRSDYDKAQASLENHQTQSADDQLRIRALSDQLAESSAQLARERDLLAAGRDVRELMSARNLHIVDVFDTDPRGKTRPAFGRIFFTEGKSLLFYAYDMPDASVKKAGYQYQIWGKKEGPNQRARNLGIFFADDKSQRRWVFQYDDPKVLNEIDSVFVTLEPPDGNPTQPKGDKLMYAYLRGQPNHP